jgi:uncharacterized protein (TIGR03067 family)
MRRCWLVIAGLAFLLAAGKPADDKAERAKLQGSWAVVKVVLDGIEVAEAAVKKMEVVIKDDKLTRKDGDDEEETTFKLDPTQKPKAIDLTPTSEERKDKTVRGIYVLDGDDLKICLAAANKPRPTAFESKEASDWELLILKRKKP